ncbi:sensor histidine kinase [Brevundimonas sp.]|uniref:sensor histidine kinase n=1 Tax=Brevundimonas sp. TaxID=1871086 RepID=UPI002D58B715|nr:histidine kinase [Brevundimonas sp.]HYC98150.1 histidine kinase [Brevundimonas sp.]
MSLARARLPTRASTILLAPRWSPVILAAMLWGLALVGHLLFTLSLNTDPLLLLFPFVWTAHGLLLTWPLHEVVRRTEGLTGWGPWLLAGLAVVLLAGLQALLDAWISGWIVRHLMPPGVGAALLVRTPHGVVDAGLRISLMIYFWVFGCYAMADSLLLSQRRLIEAQGAAQRAELAALRLQLHPHFLFNALNSVSALIVTGRLKEADAMAMSLAAFLRASLLADQATPITLADEAEALEAYLDVERVRFGDRLVVETDIPEDLYDVRMPAFLLQPLIENAIKHAVAPTARRVNIAVVVRRSGERLSLSVSDDGRGDPSLAAGTGTGLRNIRERLAATYGPAGSLATRAGPEGFTATVTLPIEP